MRKTFKYRLYPTDRQERLLDGQLEECRWLWNHLLTERKTAWDERHESLSYYDQQNALPSLKDGVRPGLKRVHSQVVQQVAKRLDLAFAAFFRRVHAGETPGYPRFRGRGRYDSLTYPQWDNGVTLDATSQRLMLSKIGDVKIVYHRPLEGTPKTATIRRTATGKWFVSITCEWEPTPLPHTGQVVGIDMGLHTFATLTQGDPIAPPRFFRQEELALAKAQRKHQIARDVHTAQRANATLRIKQDHPDLDEAGVWQMVSQDAEERAAWRERQRQRKVVARIHERVRWRREHFAQWHSRQIMNQFDLIALEDLTVTTMVHNERLAKSIHDAAWGHFRELISVKAAWAGRKSIAVNPAYTSQDCSACGWRNTNLTLADRVFVCANPDRPDCRLVVDRDLNAARNILARGRACLAQA